MAAPTVLKVWNSTAASTTTYGSGSGFTAAVGDLCILWKAGAPGSVGTGLPRYDSDNTDAGFSTAKVDTSNNGTSTKASVFYKILTSSDVSGGNLVAFNANQGGTTTLRIGLYVFRHANGWETSPLVTGVSFNTNASPPQTAATLTDESRGVVAVSVFVTGGTPTTLQYTWAGAPTGNTAARDPYSDESSNTFTQGGHGATRTDSTGVTINSGSTSHSDTHIVAADLGAALSGTGFTANQYITAVNVGVGFTSSANANAGASSVTLTQPHFGTGTSTTQADYQEFDASDTPGTVTVNTGTNTNTYVVVTAEFQAKATTIAVGTATETDTAVALGHTKKLTLGVATETDTAFAISRASSSHAVGTATETDTAVAIRPARLKPVGTATETDTAPAIRASHVVSVGLATEDDVAFSLEPQTTRTLTFLLSDPGDHGSATRKLVVYAQKASALESGTLSFALYDGATLLNTFSPTPLTTTDTAYILPITGTITDFTILEAVITIGSAGSFTAQVNDVELVFDNEVGTATETDTAFGIRPNRLKPIGTATDTETAFVIPSSHAHVIGVAVETDIALAVAAPRVLGLEANITSDSRANIATISYVSVRE